ncbi:hypothetical protein [Nonomuraea aurantiaca]|uniref:hypothetical protein n=1 Tax=Nonomuraea aurantiaca TaxID=2878562 RepID=UPI001CD97F89|nr:hypothetical protein [Nonomuraea aurantiaca]MCA2230487.1 hypothetical protein [Nonomuraea aurantiaca]
MGTGYRVMTYWHIERKSVCLFFEAESLLGVGGLGHDRGRAAASSTIMVTYAATLKLPRPGRCCAVSLAVALDTPPTGRRRAGRAVKSVFIVGLDTHQD